MNTRKSFTTPGPLPTPISLKGEGPSISDLVGQDREAPALDMIHLSTEDQETFAKALPDPTPISPARARAAQRRRKLLKPG